MNTRLRLLIDEAIEDDLAESIGAMPAFQAEYVRKLPELKGKSDRAVMEYATAENRIVLTLDSDYNSDNYPICTHPGIIRIATNTRHHIAVRDLIKRFALCGHRVEARHAIAHLNSGECVIERENAKLARYRY